MVVEPRCRVKVCVWQVGVPTWEESSICVWPQHSRLCESMLINHYVMKMRCKFLAPCKQQDNALGSENLLLKNKHKQKKSLLTRAGFEPARCVDTRGS